MTPMTMTKEDFAGLGAPDLVYVREIKASDLLKKYPGMLALLSATNEETSTKNQE